jgi:hypothetical protein
MMLTLAQRLAFTGVCVAVVGGCSATISDPTSSPVNPGPRAGSGGSGGVAGGGAGAGVGGGVGNPADRDAAPGAPVGRSDAGPRPTPGPGVDSGMGRGPTGREAGADTGPASISPTYTGQIPILPSGVPPLIAPECPGDPTAGWTEYADTFRIERPFDLPIPSRFSIADGIYTFWVMSTDNPHVSGSTTAPRTEARWSNFTNTQPHMWEADMKFDAPLDHTTIMQVHTTADGAGPVYLRVDAGAIHPLNGPNFVTGLNDKWFNIKVAFDPMTLSTTIWINNCQRLQGVIGPRGDSVFYFKNGAYTCPGTVCRDHYKNMHLYQR